MKRLLMLLMVLAVAACTTIAKVEGDHVVNGKLAVHVSAAWNKINDPWSGEPYDTWTQEGLPLDHLRFWGGVQDGKPLVEKPTRLFRSAGEKDPRVPTFRAGMTPEKLMNLFEQFYGNFGAVRVTKVEPVVFAGEKGLRFEFTLARRGDDMSMKGVVWMATHDKELYAAAFAAPQLTFYPRLLPMAEAVVKTARIKNERS